jgi:hypothetical protein
MKLKLFFTAWLAAGQALAGCPWTSAEALFRLDSDRHDPERLLTYSEVTEDVACTRLILEHFYAGQESVETSPVLRRLRAFTAPAQGIRAKELLTTLFGFHQDVYDAHLGYELGDLRAAYRPHAARLVTSAPELPEETVLATSRSVYFKVGDMKGELTSAQSQFIDLLKRHDGPVILDVRGNGGGDNDFAEAIARALHTPGERIPQSRIEEVTSPFKLVGLLNHVRVAGYRDVEQFAEMVQAQVRGKSVAEILPFTWEIEERALFGERPRAYTSELILLIDGGCASACETIVEKLSLHPRVKTMGRPTAGALHYSNAVLFELPHSAIWVKIPTRREVLENDAPEGVGYSPALEVDHVVLNDLGFSS